MIRRAAMLAAALSLAAAALPLSGPGAASPPPPGPRLAFVSLPATQGSEAGLSTVGSRGGRRVSLLREPPEAAAEVVPMPFFAPSWSADGSHLAFSAFVGDRQRKIFILGAEGGRARPVPGTQGGSGPVLSPDGRMLAFSRSRFRSDIDIHHPQRSSFYASTTTWLVELGGGKPRRLTPWRNGLESAPASFSPDGAVLALTKNDDLLDGPRAVLMRLDGSGSRVLLREAVEPVFSPDGSWVALISYANQNVVELAEGATLAGELYVVSADGSQRKRLTHAHDQVESSPSWDPSGERIAYSQFRAGDSLDQLFPYGNSIMQVNADGSCRSEVLSLRRVALYGAAWRPGPGREAGRIAC